MERIINTAEKFGTKTAVCINKYNTNLENTEKIEEFCKKQGLPIIGRIPFDLGAVKAINNGQTIVDIDCTSDRFLISSGIQVFSNIDQREPCPKSNHGLLTEHNG